MDRLRRTLGLAPREPPSPFPLTRRATDTDPGGSRPLRRRPSIHNVLHRRNSPSRHSPSPPPSPPIREEERPSAGLLFAGDETIRRYAVAPPPRPCLPVRLNTF